MMVIRIDPLCSRHGWLKCAERICMINIEENNVMEPVFVAIFSKL